MTSEACIASHRTSLDIYSREISELLLRINSVLQARQYQYILFNIQEEAIDKASEILPVLKSPTIMPLVEPGWFSMHSVIKRNDFWSIIGQLKAIGAEGILVIPIHHMID